MSSNGNQNGSSNGSDQYATYETQQYINKINSRLNIAKSQLKKYTAELSLAKSQKINTTNEYNNAKKILTQTQTNLTEGKTALNKINALKNFFKTRRDTTEAMVGIAKEMSLRIYEATRFVAQEGISRVDDILTLAKDANTEEQAQPNEQWTSLFIQATEDSDVKGVAALKAAAKATTQSFDALVSNLQVNYRTHMFYNQLTEYQSQLQIIVNRLTRENGMANSQFIKLQGNLEVIDEQVTNLTKREEEASFSVDKWNAEYLAAQQGADYKVNSGSPAS